MKETVTQSSFSEKINGKDYVVSITKCGDGYQLQLQMKTQLNNMSYDDVKLIVVDLFDRFRMDMSDKVVDNKGTTVGLCTVVDQPKKRGWPKGKKRTGQANLGGRPRKNTIVVTSNDVKNKAKKLSDDYDFFSNLPKDNAFSELGSRDYTFKGKKEIKMATVIPIHHTETEIVPMTNCGSGQVFAKIDGGRAWKCMSEIDYNAMREQQIADGKVVGLWILGIIVGAIFITIIWAWRDSNH